jgi:acetoin utilization deacetylase AcuC-like enzyme
LGFCVFNNAAIAARSFVRQTGQRVLIVDFDYHHGNGTQAVAGDGLSYVSTHAFPAYPGTGRDSYRIGDDAIVNVPLPVSGVSTEAFAAIWNRLLPAVAGAVKPGLLVISAGFDYVAGDPVGDLGVDASVATQLARAIASVAAQHCGGRVAYVLEGGYDIDALTNSIALLADASGGDDGGAENDAAEAAAIPVAIRDRIDRIADRLTFA